jgi:antirestriction protein ArdC
MEFATTARGLMTPTKTLNGWSVSWPFSAFKTVAGFYSVLAHEVTHWTGAAHRLNRDLGSRFGSAAYAGEELVAELGAAFLCADLEIANEPRADHAAYIKSWLQLLREDKRAIFTASSKAQTAVDWMHAQQGEAIRAA